MRVCERERERERKGANTFCEKKRETETENENKEKTFQRLFLCSFMMQKGLFTIRIMLMHL